MNYPKWQTSHIRVLPLCAILLGGSALFTLPTDAWAANAQTQPRTHTQQYPTWSASTAYVKGDYVTYNGNVYLARWWTQGDTPNPSMTADKYDVSWVYVQPDNNSPDNGGGIKPPANVLTPPVARINSMDSAYNPGSKTVSLSWTQDWAAADAQATSWSVLNGSTQLYSSTSFTTAPAPGQAGSQSGSGNLPVSNGVYNLVLKLCNSAGCSTSAATKIRVGADPTMAPDVPTLSSIGPVASGNPVPVSWNIYWAQKDIASNWEVLVDDKSVYKSSTFSPNMANQQGGSTSLTNIADGSHTLVLKLCNGSNCSQANGSFSVGGGPTPPPDNTVPTKPAVQTPANNTTLTNSQVNVSWNWSATSNGVQGTSWQVSSTDSSGITSVIAGPLTQFVTDTKTGQSGSTTANLTKNGTYTMKVQLCNNGSNCASSDPINVTVNSPPPATPATPALTANSPSNGKINLNWSANLASDHGAGQYWEVWNGSALMLGNQTSFGQPSTGTQSGSLTNYSVSNGSYALTVKLCNSGNTPVCSVSNTVTVSVSGGSEGKAFFTAYYPTWSEPYYTAFYAQGQLMSDTEITKVSRLAGGIPSYVTNVVLAFAKMNQMHLYKGVSQTDGDLQNLGISLTTNSASLKESIRVLKQNNPKSKVILAIGGASYNDSWSGVTDADVQGLGKLIKDLGLDGADVDFEIAQTDTQTLQQYYNAISNIRKAVDQAGGKAAGKIVTLAGWSIGADCTAQTQDTQKYPQCAQKVSYWTAGAAGRERMVLQGMGANTMLDEVSAMSYDADHEHFDPVISYKQYREIVQPGTPVALGIQPSPDEGWGDARTLVQDLGVTNNPCAQNIVDSDQYGNPKPGTFSLQRFSQEVLKNSGDGMMMWSLFADRTSLTCGGVAVSTVTELGQAVGRMLNLGSSNKQIDFTTGTNYGR